MKNTSEKFIKVDQTHKAPGPLKPWLSISNNFAVHALAGGLTTLQDNFL